jgi:hypothetical protein
MPCNACRSKATLGRHTANWITVHLCRHCFLCCRHQTHSLLPRSTPPDLHSYKLDRGATLRKGMRRFLDTASSHGFVGVGWVLFDDCFNQTASVSRCIPTKGAIPTHKTPPAPLCMPTPSKVRVPIGTHPLTDLRPSSPPKMRVCIDTHSLFSTSLANKRRA